MPSYGATEGDTAARGWRFWPVRPFRLLEYCAPGVAYWLLPSQWRVIQSFPHLVLLLGTMSSFVTLVFSIVLWYYRGCAHSLCWGRVLPIFFVTLCIHYFCVTIQQYDADLVDKQKQITEGKKEVERQYKGAMADLDGLVSKSMDAQAILAERTLDEKRRDTRKFFAVIARQLQSNTVSTPNDDLHLQFRTFAKCWLQIFSECSVEPVTHPFRPVTDFELYKCASALEVAELVSKRFTDTEITFITRKQEKTQEQLKQIGAAWKSIKASHKMVASLGKKAIAKLDNRDEDADPEKAANSGFQPSLNNVSFQPDMNIAEERAIAEQGFRWVRWGCVPKFGLEHEHPGGKSVPSSLHLGFVTIVILSDEHLKLIISFFVGITIACLFYFDSGPLTRANGKYRYCFYIAMSICEVCIAFILYDFLKIDIVQKLESECRGLEAARDAVEETRKSMVAFYDTIQSLAEMWLHLTVPRLEIMKQLGDAIEDTDPEKVCPLLTEINAKMVYLLSNVPAVPLWFGEGAMPDTAKKWFGEVLMRLTTRASAKELLDKIPEYSIKIAEERAKVERSLMGAPPRPATESGTTTVSSSACVNI